MSINIYERPEILFEIFLFNLFRLFYQVVLNISRTNIASVGIGKSTQKYWFFNETELDILGNGLLSGI